MGINARSGVAIVQTVAYVPIVPLAIFIPIRNRSHPPLMAWTPFILFSIMRLAGGPVVLALQNNEKSIGLVIAAIILLNVGLIPLLVTTLGLIQLVVLNNPQINQTARRLTYIARLCFIVAIILLSAGGSLVEYPEGRILTSVGNVVFATILAGMIFIQLLIWRKSSMLIPYTKKIIINTLLAMPLVVIRTVYALVDTFTQSDTTSLWSPIHGNVALFAIMCLLTEYITLCLYMWVGLTIPRKPGIEKQSKQLNRLCASTAETPILLLDNTMEIER